MAWASVTLLTFFFSLTTSFTLSAPQPLIQVPIKSELGLQCKALTHGPMDAYNPHSHVVNRKRKPSGKLNNKSDFAPVSPRRKAVIKIERNSKCAP